MISFKNIFIKLVNIPCVKFPINRHFNHSVNSKVWIPSNWRCEVAIARASKAKVSKVVWTIFCFFHENHFHRKPLLQ